ncbi:unnamed protein product [Lactuca virosa]|uniref:Growth-regulating factor n=1 Tax=Lactuca virosa TaxID=75947 RepID=A0AAU9NML3_9ASTR|nr:unnamed protein product [Lactuca virosa]
MDDPLLTFLISQPPSIFKTEMAATLGFPFTAAQWMELERQAMIYKYMVASVPIPYELLLPIIQNLPSLASQLKYSTKQDLEPGRCKRTDGKKWRCSRDVAPNQKYCERHMHRGRPRSRKHVELFKNPTTNNSKIRLPNPTSQSSTHSNPCRVLGSTILPSATEAPLFLDSNMHSKTVNNRGSDWSLEVGYEQQWRQIMQTSCSIFNSDFGDFTDFGTPRRDFITDKTSVVKDSSALDLSMAMGLGLGKHERDLGLVSPVSCGTAPGGPLAEVLIPGPSSVAVAVVVGSSPTSPYPTGSDSISVSPAATTVSSPCGVLQSQRTMPSLSDGSVCNSPTLASTPTDTVAFQWFT